MVIAQSEGNVCPVFLLEEYLKKLHISPDSSEFDRSLKPSRPTNWFKLVGISLKQPLGVSELKVCSA